MALSVDDVRPEAGFGGRGERGPLGYLQRLYEEFGCKGTLFVPTDWQGHFPVQQHLDWLDWLLEQPCFEVACHGHLHAVAPGSADPGEFRGIDAEAAEVRIRQSLDVFAEAGHKPLGFKAPGWFLESSAYAMLDRHFRYVADHVIGTEPSRLEGSNLLRLPYLYTIDQIGPWPDTGLVVLQSHIAPDGTITNGWCEWLYERVRAFVRTGVRLGARFVTLGEFAEEMRGPRAIDETAAAGPAVRVQDRRLYGGQVRPLRGLDVAQEGTAGP